MIFPVELPSVGNKGVVDLPLATPSKAGLMPPGAVRQLGKTAIGGYIRYTNAPFSFDGTAYWTAVTVTGTVPTGVEQPFASVRRLGDDELWTVAGQFAVPQRAVVGFDAFLPLTSALPVPYGLTFQAIYKPAGQLYEDSGDRLVMSDQPIVSTAGYRQVLAEGDAWGVRMYNAAGPVPISSLTLIVRFEDAQ